MRGHTRFAYPAASVAVDSTRGRKGLYPLPVGAAFRYILEGLLAGCQVDGSSYSEGNFVGALDEVRTVCPEDEGREAVKG